MRKGKRLFLSILVTLLLGFIMFYLFLPPINIHSNAFWAYFIFLLLVFGIINFGTGIFSIRNKEFDLKNKSNYYPFILPVIIIILITIINFINGPFFMAKKYANRITINNGVFEEEIEEVNFNTLAIVDRDSSQKLGDRVMGGIQELVSQFEVSNMYTQINYRDDIIRVTPLDYSDWIKYFTNKKNGIPGYITVNSVTGEAKLVKLDKGMQYSVNSLFFDNIYRKLRFSYPFEIFGDLSFEIDNEGVPYYIMPTISYSAVGKREDINGAIIFNAITGESQKYDISSVPVWVDHVYSPDLIIEQVDDWGTYTNGFWNTLFGQKGMKMTTDGYNYIAQDDDIYMYTGITSIVSDESNLGFILTNLRTKETKFFDCPGAEEFSAMDSARGAMQQMNYTASFPILINLSGRATYVISLKDAAGLVKMYAFVDVADYQKVIVTDSKDGIEAAAYNYLNNNGIITKGNDINITISSITNVIIDGNTYYYITDTENNKYRVSIKINSSLLPFIKVGDTVNITYSNKEIREITSIKNN